MQAAIVPAVSSSWQVKDAPQPQLGPNQVLVKMHASGICYTDVHQTLGHLPGPFPRILGHEPVGEIIAVAPDVTTRKVGDRVGTAWIQSTCGRCEWCQRGRRMFCAEAQASGLLTGRPAELAEQFAGLLWRDLMVSLLLGVAERPTPREIAGRARDATAAFLQLHPLPNDAPAA